MSAVDTKRELLRRILEERGLAGRSSLRRPPGAAPVLSHAQRRMWFLQQFAPESAAYNVAGAVDIEGPLDATALRAALTAVTARHEVLRTTYATTPEGEPVPVVHATKDVPMPHLRVTGDPGATIRDAAARPFDLALDRPLRTHLLELASDHYVLVIVIHHIAADERSWQVLLGEVMATYQCGEGAPALAPPSLQYGDFAWWQREELAQGRLDGEREFWRRRLTPPPEPLELPLDRPHPVRPNAAGARTSRALRPEVATALRAMARDEGATLFMALLAAVQTVLHRYTGSIDVTVGAPAMRRSRPEFEALVGCFGNTLLLRGDLQGDPSFRELLARLKAVCIDAFDHQELPFEQLVEDLQPPRAFGRSPLFDVTFSLRAAALDRRALGPLTVSERPVFTGATRSDLAIEARDDGRTLELAATYRAELFDATTIERMLGHLETVIEDAAASPDQRLSELALLTPLERAELETFSRGPVTDADAEPVTRMFESRAAAAPDTPAVVAGTTRWTYGELDAGANRLARRLRDAGVGSDAIVGIHLHRSADSVLAVLATLKAGGAFLPLDPALPAERLRELCAEVRPAVILTSARASGALPQHDTAVIDLDGSAAAAAPLDGANEAAESDGGDLAYVVYTSGSTGRPKGAMVTQHGIANRLQWQPRMLGLGPDDAVLHRTPLSFDVGINEVLLALVAGARLVVPPPSASADLAELRDVMIAERVTFAYFVPSVLEAFLELDVLDAVARTLEHLWCGGEPLTAALLDRIRAHFGATVYNGYGPAETTIGVTCRAYAATEPRACVTTIGRPNPNVTVRVLDENLRPVPVGVPGELCIGGAAVGRGYLGDEALTAERFPADPWDAGGRLYRSGDRARYLPSGELEFLGRADDQLKIRGYRVAPEEVETTLREHQDVRAAAVVARGGGPGGRRLAAYCVARTDTPPSELELREHLRARLPEYMVPSTFTLLDALPTRSSGKVDRAALPAPEILNAVRTAPRSALERRIAAVWCAVLERGEVGIDENFFDVGGHSLLLMRVQRGLSDDGLEVTVVDLFAHPTIGALARHLEPAGDHIETLARAGARGPRQRQALARQRALASRKERNR